MKRFLTTAFIVLALVTASAQLLSPVAVAAGGASSCPKNASVRCLNCDGSFAYCARSHAFCPECAAP